MYVTKPLPVFTNASYRTAFATTVARLLPELAFAAVTVMGRLFSGSGAPEVTLIDLAVQRTILCVATAPGTGGLFDGGSGGGGGAGVLGPVFSDPVVTTV